MNHCFVLQALIFVDNYEYHAKQMPSVIEMITILIEVLLDFYKDLLLVHDIGRDKADKHVKKGP